MRKKILICAFLLAAVQILNARQIDPSKPPPPPEAPAVKPIDPSTPPPPPSADAPDTAATPSEPVFDPLHAQRSVNVGTFYLKAGKIDAAIDRFVEAAHYEPSLAKPWKLLGEAYEKKGVYPSAIQSYKKYLELLPEADDAKKVRKRIFLLKQKVDKESSKAAAH
jgi:tetratricopeptide (TPR) repeat protein